MNNHEGTTVLNLQHFALGSASETMAGEESGLTVSIKRGAKALADAGSRIIAPVGVNLPPTLLLGAVSYCYAKGVYDSADIENKMRRSPELRAATHDTVPAASSIRRFRRLNREAIRATLEEAFRFLRRKQKTSAHAPLPGQPASAARFANLEGETTVSFVRKEAERTLNDAAFVDNMSKE